MRVHEPPVLDGELQVRVADHADAHFHLVQLVRQLLDGRLDAHLEAGKAEEEAEARN